MLQEALAALKFKDPQTTQQTMQEELSIRAKIKEISDILLSTFLCDVPSCPRGKLGCGFAKRKALAEHLKSVHAIMVDISKLTRQKNPGLYIPKDSIRRTSTSTVKVFLRIVVDPALWRSIEVELSAALPEHRKCMDPSVIEKPPAWAYRINLKLCIVAKKVGWGPKPIDTSVVL